MKRVIAKLTVLAALSCVYVLGLNAASQAAKPHFQVCCTSTSSYCCGAMCYADISGCKAIP